MIVVDASAALEIVLQTPAGAPLTAKLLAPDVDLHAPELLDVEVAQVLRRLDRRGNLSANRAAAALFSGRLRAAITDFS